MIIQRVGPLSVGKILGGIYAVLGFVMGALFTLFAMLGLLAGASSEPEAAWLAPLFGAAAIVVFPILYGLVAFVMGVVVGGLYNLAAARFGGIEIALSEAVTSG